MEVKWYLCGLWKACLKNTIKLKAKKYYQNKAIKGTIPYAAIQVATEGTIVAVAITIHKKSQKGMCSMMNSYWHSVGPKIY